MFTTDFIPDKAGEWLVDAQDLSCSCLNHYEPLVIRLDFPQEANDDQRVVNCSHDLQPESHLDQVALVVESNDCFLCLGSFAFKL